MVEGIRREGHLPLIDKLVNLYFDEESNEKHRDRIRQFWIKLDLDEHVKIGANRKIAERLSRFRSLSELRARHLVFWHDLKRSGSRYGSQIVANLLPELQSDVDRGNVTENDMFILRTMSENSTGPNHEECEQLYLRARVLVYGRENEDALQFIHDQVDSLTVQKGV